MMNDWLNARAVTQYHNQQEQEARLLLKELITLSKDPQPFEKVKHEFV
jgi:hypothetical protein